MALALPPAPAAPPRRLVLVGTTVASLAAVMIVGGMLGVFIRQRQAALDADQPWLPEGTMMPEVPTNVMLISFYALVLFAQWAVYAARRRDRLHIGLSLGLVGLVGLAIVNAQVFVYNRIGLPVETTYAELFYATTGTMLVLVIAGLVFTGVTAFRLLGGRETDREIVAAHALYWYVLTAIFSALWLIVFVTK